jgi:hypothetical protein
MKRNWDLIREVLIEVEALDTHTRDKKQYEVRYRQPKDTDAKAEQAFLLFKAGLIHAIDAGSMDGPSLMSPELTWEGHELLETMRSKPVWERIKKTATEKGIELSFDSIKALAVKALAAIIGG